MEGGAPPHRKQHLTGSSGSCYVAIDGVGAARKPCDELELRFQRFRRFLGHRIEYANWYLLRQPLSTVELIDRAAFCRGVSGVESSAVLCELTAWSVESHAWIHTFRETWAHAWDAGMPNEHSSDSIRIAVDTW